MITENKYITTEYTINDTVIGETISQKNKIIQVNIFAENITSEKELNNISKIIELFKNKVWK